MTNFTPLPADLLPHLTFEEEMLYGVIRKGDAMMMGQPVDVLVVHGGNAREDIRALVVKVATLRQRLGDVVRGP